MDQKTSMNNPNRTEEWINLLKYNGYRITSPRRVVVEILAKTDRALTAIDTFDLAREHHPSIGLVSIYRTLDKLESLNLIQRVHHPEGCHAYIAAFTGHQHLLLCQSCGATVFFQGDNIDTLVTKVEEESGFQIRDHWLQFFGICATCLDEVRIEP
jgi:Fe2+ or Zn2+ uptake regulation protein